MARARNIKPAFFINEDLIELPFEARLLFIGLWTLADREGRLENRPKKIKMSLFPADEINVIEQLSNISNLGFIECYNVCDTNIIQIVNFAKHQNPHGLEKDSELPDKNGYYTVFDRVKKLAKGEPRLVSHKEWCELTQREFKQTTDNAELNSSPEKEQDNNSYETVSLLDRNALNPESLNLIPDSLNPSKTHLSTNSDQQTYGEALTPNQILKLWQPDQKLLAEHLKFALAKPVEPAMLTEILIKFNTQYEHVVLTQNQKHTKLAGWIKDAQSKQERKPKLATASKSGAVNKNWPDYIPEPIEVDQEEQSAKLKARGLI